ncbi:MAG: aminotransferase class IV [Pseudomonadota bacterium]
MIDARVLPFAYLNGDILPIEQAKIPALDRGFLFGDAIYEVIPVYQGQLFRAGSHIDRLMDGLAKIHIASSFDAQEWRTVFATTAKANGAIDQYIYLQVTRGVSHYRDHATPSDIDPLVFAMSQKLPPRAKAALEHGIATTLLPDTRWSRCDIKSTSLLANVLLRQRAIDDDCVEAILHADGFVTEGAASTIMMAVDGTLVVPPNSNAILPGTTRRLVEELADTAGIPCQTTRLALDVFMRADEVMLSAATKELLPVTSVDGKAVGNGRPGPIWAALDSAFQEYKLATLADTDAQP